MHRNQSYISVFLGILLVAGCVTVSDAAAPSFSGIPNQTIDEDTSTDIIPFAVSSQSSSIIGISGSSSDTNLVANANISFTFQAPNWQLLVTPTANQFGKTTITLTAEDANSQIGSTSFELTVNPVRDPITIRLLNPSEGQIFLAPGNIEVIAEVSNPDGGELRVDFRQSGSGVSTMFDFATSPPFTGKWSAVPAGNYSLTGIATDEDGIRTASAPVNIQVLTQLIPGATLPVNVLEGNLNAKRTVQIPIFGLPQLGEETITYWTSDGTENGSVQDFTGIGGIDYLQIPPTNLTINAQTLTTTLTVEILGDVLDERNKLFFLNWSSTNQSFLVSTQLVVNIIDDDPLPLVSINDVQVPESGGEALFTLSMSAQSLRAVTVFFSTENGTAIGDEDFIVEAATNFVTIPKGFFSKTVRVPIQDDAFDEPNETFFVNLGQTVNVGIAKGRGQATILDDDEPPILSVREETPARDQADPTQNTDAVFSVALSIPSGFPISVDYTTIDDTALAGFDYEATAGTLVFNPGDTNREVVVHTLDDLLSEAPEVFFLRLSKPTNVALPDPPQNRAIIFDTDPLPSLAIGPVFVSEPDVDSTNAFFEVQLSQPSGRIVTVQYATSDATAKAGSDYIEQADSLSFQPEELVKTITVPILGDREIESDETFFVQLSSPDNAIILLGVTFGIIVDNEPLTTVSIDDASVTEGNESFVNAVFTVRLADPIEREVTVAFSTMDETAEVNADYIPTSGTLKFNAGETQQTISVQILGDRLNEADESFKVVLSNPVEVLIEDGEGIGLIKDNDPAPLLSVDHGLDLEGNTPGSEALFQVNLLSPSGQIVTLDYAPSSGTAKAGFDFLDALGAISISPGETAATFTIPLIADTIDEPDEEFFVDLSARNATPLVNRAQFTILNDDSPPRLVVPEKSIPEGNAGITSGSLDVQLSSPSGKQVSVDYKTNDGTAFASEDYVALKTQRLVFEPGTTNQTINVEIIGDELREADEVFSLEFENLINATFPQIPSQMIIIDDDNLAGLSVSDISLAEGDSGIAEAVFTVVLSAPAQETVSFNFATMPETASEFDDFFPSTGSRIIEPGESAATISILINSDRLHESDESFLLKISSPRNAVLLTPQARALIQNDDAEPVLSVSAPALLEGDTAAVSAVVTVSLSNASGQVVAVDYATEDGTATVGLDYLAASDRLEILPGEFEKSFAVQVFGDSLNEAKETIVVLLSNPQNASLAPAQNQTQLTILNDDPFPEISIADALATEAGTESVSMEFAVRLSPASGQEVSVSYFTSIGTATPGTDYVARAESLIFAPGEVDKIITIEIPGDTIPESEETFFVNLNNLKNALPGKLTAEGRIIDGDAVPVISIGDVGVEEGNGAVSQLLFPVQLSGPSAQVIKVSFATSNGTAEAGSDYVPTSGTLSIQPGETNTAIPVTVFSDFIDETDETLTVRLSILDSNSLLDSENLLGTGTIRDDDPSPVLSVENITVIEGNTGSFKVAILATLTSPSDRIVTVDFETVNGSASPESDYIATAGSLQFERGQTSRPINVVVNSDMVHESSETFSINFSSPENAELANAAAIVTIVNDDPAPQISINDLKIQEGDAGTSQVTITITLSSPSAEAVTARVRTVDGTATAETDFLLVDEIVTFEPGTITQTVILTTAGDSLSEPDETFSIQLSELQNATAEEDHAEAIILDNDPLPLLTIEDFSVPEGNAGLVESSFTANLSTSSGRRITVEYASTNDTATVGNDYISSNGVLVFDPGETSKTVPIFVFGDIHHESNESFFIDFINDPNVKLDRARIQGVILDDDPTPTVSVGDADVIEGNSGSFTVVVPVSLSAPAGDVVSVNFSLSEGTATGGSDYESNSGTVTFPSGETLAQIPVSINGDSRVEPDETFTILLSPAINAEPAKTRGTVRIINDDLFPFISIADSSMTEGDPGTKNALFRVSLSEPSNAIVTVSYITVNGTAQENDFDSITDGILTILPGEQSGDIPVVIQGDSLAEPDEIFFVRLINVENALIRDFQALGTIADDDAPFGISVSDGAITEGNSGTATMDFVVSLSTPSPHPVSVAYSTLDGTASAESDYDSEADILVFRSEEVSKTVSITIHGDQFDETNEFFFLQLSDETSAVLLDNQGIGTITDDDPVPAIEIGNATVVEGSGIFVPIDLSEPSRQVISVNYSTEQGTAKASTDYKSMEGKLTFNPGEISKTIAIETLDDSISEPDETFTILLSDPRNTNLAKQTASVLVKDNDAVPAISIADVVVQETDAISTSAVFSVSLNTPSAQPVSVSFLTVADTALEDSDFTHASGVLIFPAGTTNLTLAVEVIGGLIQETEEQFVVNINSPGSATIARPNATATILDNDVEPTISISDASVVEGNIGSDRIGFTIRLSEPGKQIISVNYSTTQGTGTASEGIDYVALSGVVTFQPGVVTNIVSLDVIGDLLDEPNETIEIRLETPVNAQLSDGTAFGTIIDDDVPPSITVLDSVVSEGNSGTTATVFTVRLSSSSGQTVSVDYATADATATGGADFENRSGKLVFEPGTQTQSIEVPIIGDTLEEADETFFVNLTNPDHAVLIDPQGLGTILNDDIAVNQPPSVRIVSPLNGSSFTVPAEIVISAEATDRGGRVQKVDFFVGSILVGTSTSAPFSFTWMNDAIGAYALKVVATDDDGATTTSESVRILVNRSPVISEVAIVRNFPDPEIRRIQDYLVELGLSSQIFEQEGLNFESIGDYKLIIWDDLGGLDQGLTENDVRVFQEAQENLIPVYFIGEVLSASGRALTASSQSDWARLVHLSLGSSGNSTSLIIPDQTLEHPVVNGRFGIVPNFSYTPDIDSVFQPAPGVSVLAQSGNSDVLVAFEEESFDQTRSVTQSFLVTSGEDTRSITERKRLFKNAVVWLTRRNFQALTDLSVFVSGPAEQVSVGQEFIYSATIRQRGEISGTGITVTVDLPSGVRLVRGDFIQGTLEEIDGMLIYNLGNLENGQQASVAFTLVANQSGPLTLRATIGGNEPDPVLTNNTAEYETVVAPGVGGPPILTLDQLGNDVLELQVSNQSSRQVRIQSSQDLVRWLDLTNTTARLFLLRIENLTTPNTSIQFYRVVSP